MRFRLLLNAPFQVGASALGSGGQGTPPMYGRPPSSRLYTGGNKGRGSARASRRACGSARVCAASRGWGP
eukprot:7823286-Pyramimonas_sp.AAC.1